ncbi:DUF1289 domain-containing protein [Stieleria mannarensis]|uniref:DUF1289 domain-containing protein n=1 Tax=Stieleria mannarensis TaxID=2755585 RepID=UPI0016049E04|nr:DUF1289 domain-containing protein [Rhodopirellula sp. JC639]
MPSQPESSEEATPLTSQSPCIDHCAIDASQTCLGCFRTLDEIARWSLMTDEERRETNRRCRQRRGQT